MKKQLAILITSFFYSFLILLLYLACLFHNFNFSLHFTHNETSQRAHKRLVKVYLTFTIAL